VLDAASHELAQIVLQSLAAGKAVEIEGLGIFHPDTARGVRFEPFGQPSVFVAYAREDSAAALRLCDALEAEGFRPWIDVRRLLPGQNWPRAIEAAIETADFFVACFSAYAVGKKGGFQAEVRYAIDCARRVPLDDIFIVPVRLNSCPVPRAIQREWQYIDLFPSFPTGVRELVRMMHRELNHRVQGTRAKA